MKNLLVELEEHKIEHFVLKSYITCAFDRNDYRSEYHIYYDINDRVGQWNVKTIENGRELKFKLLSKFELQYFKANISKYEIEKESENGKIFTNKTVGFVVEKILCVHNE